MKRLFLYIVLLALMPSFVSCRKHVSSYGGDPMSAELSDMKALWNRYNETRDYDSLIIATRPFYEKSLAAGDSAAVLYSGVFIAQAYLFSDRIDSARTLLDSVLPYMECTDSPQIRIVVSNVPVVPQRKFFLLDQRCRYLWLFGHLWGRTL